MARRPYGRKLKAPVLGRLTLAWVGTAAICGVGLFVLADEQTPSVKIAVEGAVPQRMAPPTRLAQPAQLAPSQAAIIAETGSTAQRNIDLSAQTTAMRETNNLALANSDTSPLEGLEAEQLADGVSVRSGILPSNNKGFPSQSSAPSDRRPKVIKIERADPSSLDPYSEFDDNGADAGELVITIDGKPARTLVENGSSKRRVIAPTPIASINPQLSRRTEYGTVPTIAPNGARPSDVYAFNFRPNDNPNVAIIVGGLGLDREITQRAIDELPATVSLAFAPYAKNLSYWSERARQKGHEILLELPMEQGSRSTINLGPAALLTSRSRDENLQRLDWLMSRFNGYFAVTNYLGAQFSGDPTAISPVLARLRASGLGYFDDTGAVLRFNDTAARDVASVTRVISPQTADPAADFALLERVAQRDGLSIGKAYASVKLFDELSAWAWSLEDKQLTLAPASAVFALRKSEL